ncbi:portal protein [Mycobacterium phage Vincenzo]|uniref:Portal protein n=2 Tax=Coopervirus vincenzo TaxID=1983110 RepID=A0A0F6SJI4_9CAUD|nr:portal protein [Mycobacterium phage Vincenzo]AKF14272.1 portal protein [Mycobacterium phage Vincenzo]AKF14675.1 portal protein [Mycobacterium phage AlanGrant]
MAASNLRVTRRPKGSPARRSLTAASQPVLDTRKAFRAVAGNIGRADWQAEAWDSMDMVGELRYYVGWRASSCSRVDLIASEIDDETGKPTGGIRDDDPDGLRFLQIVKAMAGGPLGQAQLLKRAAECLTVPGEHYIVLLDQGDKNNDGTPRHNWYAVTREEVKNKGGDETDIELPDGTLHPYNKRRDTMFRVWNPRPRRAQEPDSPVRACLDSLREIIRTTKKIRNASKSRLIGNGVVFLPQELSLPSAQAPTAEPADPDLPVPIVTGVPAADELSNLLFQTAEAAVDDEDSQAALIPLLATVPGEHLQKIFHLKIGNEITEVEIKTRNDAIARLAMGLDVSPERLLGLGSNSNHWSAWQIGDEDVQLHIKPVMEVLCAAIYREVLVKVLRGEGIDPDKYVLWYDASGLTVDPDKTDEATAAKEQGAITHEAYRRYLGLADEDGYDLETLEGAQAWARDAIVADPTLITTLAPLLEGTDLGEIEFPVPQPALPPGESDQTDEDTEGGEPATEDNAGSDTAGAGVSSVADMVLAERLLTTRALGLAGKRRVNVRDTAQKARLTGIAPHDYHRVMGPVADADIPRLIAGWDEGLEEEALALLGIDTARTEALRSAVRAQVRRELTMPVVDAEVC